MNAPNQTVWLIAIIVGVVGLLGKLGVISAAAVAGNAFWLVFAGFALLAVATVVKGL
jgi:hypothetical protein